MTDAQAKRMPAVDRGDQADFFGYFLGRTDESIPDTVHINDPPWAPRVIT